MLATYLIHIVQVLADEDSWKRILENRQTTWCWGGAVKSVSDVVRSEDLRLKYVCVCICSPGMTDVLFEYVYVMFVPAGRCSEKGGGSPPQAIVVKVLLRREAHTFVVKVISPVVK